MSLEDLAARVAQEKAENIKKIVRELKSKKCKEAIENVRKIAIQAEKNLLANERLDAAGFGRPFTSWGSYQYGTLKVDAKQLIPLRKVLNSQFTLNYKRLDNSDEKLIRVHLTVKDYPDLDVFYTAPVPRKKKGKAAPKCRVVKVRHKAYTEKVLQCSV